MCRMFLPRLILPWAKTSELSANSRLHWRKRNALVKAQKETTQALALEAGWHLASIPDGATVSYSLTYCLPSRVAHADDDNIITANKGARDALAAVLGIDDRNFRLSRIEQGERSKNGGIIIEAEIV